MGLEPWEPEDVPGTAHCEDTAEFRGTASLADPVVREPGAVTSTIITPVSQLKLPQRTHHKLLSWI